MSRSALRLAPRPWLQSPAAALLGTALTAAGAVGLATAGTRPDPDAVLAQVWEVVRSQPIEGPLLPATRARATALRALVGAWPTEAKRRVAYAAILYAGARDDADRAAAAFHAAAAARLAPATAPVQSAAAVLLAGSGDPDLGLACVRTLFAFAPRDAARTLLQLEPLLDPEVLERGLPPTAAATLAWAARLREEGEVEEADRWLARAFARWPEEVPVLRAVALLDRDRRDWPAAARRLRGRALPPDLLALRARALAESGDPLPARRDLEAALRGDATRPDLLQLCGEAALALPDVPRARTLFEAALHRLPEDAPQGKRIGLLRRLAAAEERLGHAGAALRLWREVLALDGADPAAGARVASLTGTAP